VTFQCQYFTINSSISECNHKYELRNTEQEIGTDGSSQTRRNPRVDGYGAGFGSQRVSGSGFWTVLEPNRPIFAVQTRNAGRLPGPIANTNLESQPTSPGRIPSSLGTLLECLEIIATPYSSTIVKTHVFSLYSPLCIYVSMYQCIYIATHLHTVYLDWLQAMPKSNSRCA